ncbi:MAG: glycosyltransferase family 2 protein [Candidatus Marinimicrobia bacterium]|jgi:glycosyltransferase involved in cell wall biosynthesis|nr:glycosyltransferase family 2 protein [Candidatus Neomarinimicrobiota bacterium]MBT3632807.1 glycosyltransferase family 2 protein [Candidatus Neomarinimicrobiota bacterium]MBT3681917.1 glycosyltransferase family 2 protein [Candidatus Neomarinimicrobiota bacterium]MBT3759054.1 glycosyltransferase family 2 protein [Candidatus Neomarinimicrobiota bacterium]MBT3895047.1 glycosyltransferase family 2 protein [Candidatus Neomarinimicrobiota bacterium]
MNLETQPKVSMIVPVFNGGKTFQRCLKSLLKQDFPCERLSIIIVDDCSNDGTLEWLTAQHLPAHFIIIRHQENKGRAAARNSGLSDADGEIIIFLDGDMEVQQDFVNAHVEAINQPSVIAVTGKMLGDPGYPNTRLRKYLFQYKYRGARQFGENHPIPYQYLLTGNMSVKREVLQDYGNFDESFSGYGGEDTLFAYTIWKQHSKGLRYSEKPVSTDLQEYSLDGLLEKMYQYGKNNLPILIQKYPEMIPALRADFLVGSSFKKRISDIFLNPLFHTIARWKYHIIPWPLSNFFIPILLMGSLRAGYKHRRISSE